MSSNEKEFPNSMAAKPYLKVGVKVHFPSCSAADFDGNGYITKIDDGGFWVNNCFHPYTSVSKIKVLNMKKDADNVQVGDVIFHRSGGTKRAILAVVGEMIAVSVKDDFQTFDKWVSREVLRSELADGTQSFEEQVTAPREVTMAEVVAKFGESVVIKKEN